MSCFSLIFVTFEPFKPVFTSLSFHPAGLLVPGQAVEESLEFLAHNADHPTFDGIVGHIDEKDEGRRLRKLVVLCVRKYKDVSDAS